LLALWPGFDFHAWVIAALLDLEVREAEDLLDDLVKAQLVEPSAGQDRYQMHDLLRLFAREQLKQEEPAEDREAAWIRLAEAALSFTRRMTIAVTPQRRQDPQVDGERISPESALYWLEAERANLVTLAAETARLGPQKVSWQLAGMLHDFLDYRGYRRDLALVCEAALEASLLAGDLEARNGAYLGLQHAYVSDHRLDDAERVLNEYIAELRKDGDVEDQIFCLSKLVHVYQLQKRPTEAENLLNECLQIARESGYEHHEAILLRQMGELYRRLDRLTDARDALTASLAISVKHGHSDHVAEELEVLADIYADQDQFDEAEFALTEGRNIYRRLKSRHGEATALRAIAHVYERCGHDHDPERALMDALAIFRELKDRTCEIGTLTCLSHVYEGRDDLERAEDVLVAASGICREIGDESTFSEKQQLIDRLHRKLLGAGED
jgi:tetratricopeptide (TPR) repeat protein